MTQQNPLLEAIMEELRKQSETLPTAPPTPSPTPMPIPLSPAGPTTAPVPPTGLSAFQQAIQEAGQRMQQPPGPPAPTTGPAAPIPAPTAPTSAPAGPRPEASFADWGMTAGGRDESSKEYGSRLLSTYGKALAYPFTQILPAWERIEAEIRGQDELERVSGQTAVAGMFSEALGGSGLKEERTQLDEAAKTHRAEMKITKWTSGEYGDPMSWSSAKTLRDELVAESEELGLGTQVLEGMSSSIALLPIPILDQVFGLILRGGWGALKLPFKGRRLLVDMLSDTAATPNPSPDGIHIKPELEIANPEIIQESVDNMPIGKIAFIHPMVDDGGTGAGAYVRFFDEAELSKFEELEKRGLGFIQYKGQKNATNQYRNYKERVKRIEMDEEAARPYDPAPGPEPVVTEVAPVPAPARVRVLEPEAEAPMTLEQLEAEFRRLDPIVGELEQQADAARGAFSKDKENFLRSARLRAFREAFDAEPGRIKNSILNKFLPDGRKLPTRAVKSPSGDVTKTVSSFEELDYLADEWNSPRGWNLGVQPGPEGKVLIDDVISALFRQMDEADRGRDLQRQAADARKELNRIKTRMRNQGLREIGQAITEPRALDEGVVDDFAARNPGNVTEIEGVGPGTAGLNSRLAMDNDPDGLIHRFRRLVWYEGNPPDNYMHPGVNQAWDDSIDSLRDAYLLALDVPDNTAASLLDKVISGVSSIPADELTTREVGAELDKILESIKAGTDYNPPRASQLPSIEATPTPTPWPEVYSGGRLRTPFEQTFDALTRAANDQEAQEAITKFTTYADDGSIIDDPSFRLRAMKETLDKFDDSPELRRAKKAIDERILGEVAPAPRTAPEQVTGGNIFNPQAREIPGATWEEKWNNLPPVVRKLHPSGRVSLSVEEQEQLRDFLIEFGQDNEFNGTIVQGYGGRTLEFHLGYIDIGSPGGMYDGYIIWNPSTSTSRMGAERQGNVFGMHRTTPEKREIELTRTKAQRGDYGIPDDTARETLGIFSISQDFSAAPALTPVRVPSPAEMVDPDRPFNPDQTLSAWITDKTDVQEIINQHGEFMVVIKDVNGHRAMMKASDYVTLKDNPYFMDRVREVFVNRHYAEYPDIPEAQDGFMNNLNVENALRDAKDALRPGVVPGGELADLSGIKLTARGSILPSQKEKFIAMFSNSGIRRILTSFGIKEVKLEPPYEFRLSEQGNYSSINKVISINIDAEDPTHTMLHELGHAVLGGEEFVTLEGLPTEAYTALLQRAKASTNPRIQGYLENAQNAERLGNLGDAEDDLVEAVVDLLFTDPDFAPEYFARLSVEDNIIEHAPTPPVEAEQGPRAFMQQGMDLGPEAGEAPPIQGGLDMGAAGAGVEQTPLLDADQIAQKSEINRQREAGQTGFDDMEGLAELGRINGDPGTQYSLEVTHSGHRPHSTTTLTIDGVSRTQHRWRVTTDMEESRRAFERAGNLEEFNFRANVVGYITKFEDEKIYRLHELGDTVADPGRVISEIPVYSLFPEADLNTIIRNVVWDVNNNALSIRGPNGEILPFGAQGGGGGSWRGRRHATANYTGDDGQLRLHRDINEGILNLRKRRRLLERVAGEADQPPRAVERMRAQVAEEADRLTVLLRNIVDSAYQQITTVPPEEIRRAVYTETSAVTIVPPAERSGLLIARGADTEMQGMGRNVTEQALEAQQRLADHRYTKQLLEQVIRDQEEGWEETVTIIREDLEDEANILGILADLMAEEGSDASRGVVRGLRDEIYDEIGTVNPKLIGGWGSMYEGGTGSARPPGGWAGEDPDLQRQLDRIMEDAATNDYQVQYQGAGPMADDEIGRFADSPAPPRIPTIVSEPGQGFIRLPNLRHIREFLTEDIVDENNPIVQWIYQYTPMNWVDKSVNAITPAAKLKIAYMMAQVADDQYLEVLMQSVWDSYAKSAPRTFFGKRISGPLRKLLPGTGIMDLPINWKTGSWGDSGIQWNDIWENYNGIHKAYVDKYSDRLDGKLRHLIAEFASIVNIEIEQLRKVNGLTERRRLRPIGEVYMPRKAVRFYDEATKRYYDFEKPSNPNHERLWMSAQDVYEKHGVDFMADPRAVLELHVRQALREIRHFQMEEMIEEFGFAVKVSDLVDPQIVAERADALGAWQAAQKALKAAVRAEYGEELQTRIGKLIADMNVDLGLDADISRAQAALRDERGPVRAQLAGEVLRLTADEHRAKIAFYQARQAYKKAVDRAREKEFIKLADDHSPLWGGTLKAGVHPITPNRFKTKFFLTEDARHLESFIQGLDPDNASVAATTFNTLANTSRFLASVGDFAMPFQHLLPVMWRRPDAWVNATFNHYRAFWDPAVQARLVRQNIDDYWELALNGVPVGDPEFFAALAPGQGIDFDSIIRRAEAKGPENMSAAERVAVKHARQGLRISKMGGKQIFGRFQTSYQTGLGFARVLLYKALKNNKKWDGKKNELFSYIRNMTGGMDSRRLGIGPTQRGIEGMWIAFSPRLLRSTLALTADAIQALFADPGLIATAGFKEVTGRASARQTESLATIRNMIAGVFSLYTLAGLGMGKDWDEIKQGMNPLNGRRFLSYQFNGDWIGVGGQMRALMQFSWSVMGLLSRQRGEFSDLTSMNMMKNPFIYFFMSRGAPGITFGGTAAESFTDVDILPFDDPDGGLDFLAHYGTNSAPFALQHYIESRTWESAAMEMFGARASFNPRDRATSYITSGEESVYADQPPMIKWLVNEMIDDGTTFDSIEMKRRKELLSLPRSGLSYMQWKSVEDKFSGRRGQAAEEEEFGKNDVNDSDPMKRAMAQYYELFRHPRVRDAEGISMPNGDEIFSRLFKAKANLSVEQGGWGWTTEQAMHVIANTNRRPVPWFVLSQISGARKDSIVRSQRMREQMFVDMGRKDLAMIIHRLFYMYPPEQGAFSETVNRLVEGGPHDFGPYMSEEAWGHQEQRLEDIREAGGALGAPGAGIESIVEMAR